MSEVPHRDAGISIALGPKSEIGKLALDPRLALVGFPAGILQLMHPAVSAGVVEHSDFFNDPYERIVRSVPRIVASIVADDSPERAANIRGYHHHIKGVDHHGNQYHALNPDTFWWTHATFVWAFLQISDDFHHRPIAGRRREQFYQESVEWYRRYGLSMRPMPDTLEAFDGEFDRMCAEVLEMTPAAERAVAIALGEPMSLPLVPPPIGQLLGISTMPLVKLTAIGGLPPAVRDRFDIPWSATDARARAAMKVAVKNASRVLPQPVLSGLMTQTLKRVGAATYLTSVAPH
ncbi:MAG: oxygenase MpaB family protein [Aeromicrobium sp.]